MKYQSRTNAFYTCHSYQLAYQTGAEYFSIIIFHEIRFIAPISNQILSINNKINPLNVPIMKLIQYLPVFNIIV